MTIIGADTTWTTANSPVTFTGPIVVNTGVTLTINAGVTVNLNNYYLYVNGTVRAIGTNSGNIQIYGGSITFSNSSGAGSIFQNAAINSSITSSSTLTVINSTINSGSLTVGDSSVLTNNIISSQVTARNSCNFINNNISGDISAGNLCALTGNTLLGDITTGQSTKISNNTIMGSKIVLAPFGGHSYTIALTVGSTSTITNNTVSGGVTAISSSISNNTISGGAPFTDWAGRGEDSTSALEVSGTSSSVTGNIIWSSTGGYGVLLRAGYTVVSGNVIEDSLRIAGDALVEGNYISHGGTGVQVGDIFISAFNDINYGQGNSIIRNNVITGNYLGIGSSYAGGSAVIQQNLISNNSLGIQVNSNMVIQNNTIANSSTAIRLQGFAPAISFNNIVNCTENTIYLSSVSTNVNATYNWWGTTNTQTINFTIHDFKYDLNLGAVNFVPFLTTANPQAGPENSIAPTPTPTPAPTPVIPEFPTLTMLPLILAAILITMVIAKQKTKQHQNLKKP